MKSLKRKNTNETHILLSSLAILSLYASDTKDNKKPYKC